MSKKTVVQFTASWMPGEGEKSDPNLAFSGMIQVLDGMPTKIPAHVLLREYLEEGGKQKPSWWPGVSEPEKKQVNYGPAFADEYPYTTDLHQVRIAKGSVITIKAKDGTVRRYQVEKVEDLTA